MTNLIQEEGKYQSPQIHLFRISNVNQTWFMNCQDKLRYHLKNRDWKTVSNIKYTKSYASLADPFIQNLKRKPNMIHDLSRKMNIPLKKQRLENSVKHQIHQIIRINSKNGNTEYCGSTYAKNEIVLK